MTRTDQDFVDGLALDLFSPVNRTLVVTLNTSPLPGNFVTGSTGEGFINLSNYSWIIEMNETARDLIAKVELPYDPVALRQQGVDVSNTYVGTLAADKKSWVISESQRNVHVYVAFLWFPSLCIASPMACVSDLDLAPKIRLASSR